MNVDRLHTLFSESFFYVAHEVSNNDFSYHLLFIIDNTCLIAK